MIGRHEVLRTVIAEVAGEAWQRIEAPGPAVLEVVEASAESVGGLLAEAASHGFDLSSELPIRGAA